MLQFLLILTQVHASQCPNLAGEYLDSHKNQLSVSQRQSNAGTEYSILKSLGEERLVLIADGKTYKFSQPSSALGPVVSYRKTSCIRNALVRQTKIYSVDKDTGQQAATPIGTNRILFMLNRDGSTLFETRNDTAFGTKIPGDKTDWQRLK